MSSASGYCLHDQHQCHIFPPGTTTTTAFNSNSLLGLLVISIARGNIVVIIVIGVAVVFDPPHLYLFSLYLVRSSTSIDSLTRGWCVPPALSLSCPHYPGIQQRRGVDVEVAVRGQPSWRQRIKKRLRTTRWLPLASKAHPAERRIHKLINRLTTRWQASR